MKKRICSFVLMFAMLAILMPSSLVGITVFAGDDDFFIEDGVLIRYKGQGGDVVIPNTVTCIGESAFQQCGKMTSVTIPNTVTSIGESAFALCFGLKSITIPDSVTEIGDLAFYDCNGLTSVTIPDSVISLGNAAFSDCYNLENVKISNSITSIKIQTFSDCQRLTSVTIPPSVTSLGSVSFSGCNSLTSITIPQSVKNIGEGAFESCSALTDVYYIGAESGWNQIQIEKSNDPLTAATKHFSISLSIISHPSNVIVTDGESVTFTVRVRGQNLSYQWYYKKAGQTDWSKWETSHTASITGKADSSWNGMHVYCEIMDDYDDRIDSFPAAVTVMQCVKITAQPVSRTIALGDSLPLWLRAEGTGLTYQWYFKKPSQTSYSKWNARTHAVENVTPNATWNGIRLYCVVRDFSGNQVQSGTVKVLFSDVVTIVKQPVDVTAKTGDNVKFTIQAEGVGLTYQWQYRKSGQTSWNNWGTRTTASTIATSNASWDGMQVRCVVKNSTGSCVTSNPAKITLSDCLTVTRHPSDMTTQAGNHVTFTVKANGVGLTYQWQYRKSGQTSRNMWEARTTASTTATSNASWDGMQVRCLVRDSTGKTVTSKAADITIR